MVELRFHQRTMWEGWFPEEASGWWEEWMKQADQVLDDEELLDSVYEAQGRRWPKSRRRGRKQTPSEVTLRLAVLKHVRNWSFEETEREVRANVVYRQFTRIGAQKVPDAKTLGRLLQTLGPDVVQQIHQRLVAVAQEKKVARGQRLRVDTTVVERNIHYPTDSGLKRAKDHEQKLVLQGLRKDLETMLPRVRQVIRQSRARVLGGDVHVAGKLVSIFEPSTEVIRKGKASKPTEFGKMVKIQEAENQIITHYQVFAKRPNDADLLVPAVQKHEEQFGRVPQLVAGDAGFYSASNEAELSEMGVKQISVPNRSTKSPERRRHQKKRSFRRGQKWRTGVEGRISVLKRRHGLNRCRYRGDAGMQRWVGLGVIADNLINIGRFLAANDTG